MRFWDSSAVVPLLVEERTSRACRHALRADPAQLVWCLSRTEAISALCRRQREGALDAGEVRVAQGRLARLAARWAEIDAVAPVQEVAERLLRVHPLRAADALQLGAALVAVDGRPRGRAFVALDATLLAAAEREGFDAVAPAQ
jgi:predicted nucleic acid-binding protein